MKHLTDDELSAYLDGAHRDAEAAARHLAACERCRVALAGMAARDAALKPALTHDPGEAYFERFAARVEQRIATTAPARRGAAWDLGTLFRSPRALAWAGGVAVLVVGAGLALMTTREVTPPHLRGSRLDALTESPAPAQPPTAPSSEAAPPTIEPSNETMGLPAPPVGADVPETPTAQEGEVDRFREERQAAGSTRAKEQLAKDDRAADAKARSGFAQPPPSASMSVPQTAPPAAPSRAVEVRPNASGEELRARRDAAPAAPSPSTGARSDQAGQVRKRTMAQPLEAAKKTATEGARDESTGRTSNFMAPPAGRGAPFAEAESRLCGEVLDASGRPVAGAQVAVTDLVRSVTTDASGRFCVSVSKGDHAISVLAVGYRESRQTVRVDATETEARFTLAAVPVLEGGALARGLRGQARVEPEPRSEARDAYAALPDTLRGMVRTAQRLDADAAVRRSAAAYDHAAVSWERVLRRLMGGPLEIETRRSLAVARYRAWELDPGPRRARDAIAALTAYATRAPAGPERDEAARWLDRVRP